MVKWVRRGIHMLSIPFEMTKLVEYSLYGHFVTVGFWVEDPSASLSCRRRQHHKLWLSRRGRCARTHKGPTFNRKKKIQFDWRLAAVGWSPSILYGEFTETSLIKIDLIWPKCSQTVTDPSIVTIILITSHSHEAIMEGVFQWIFVIIKH